MTKSQQVGVLGALLVVIVLVGGWRTWSAVQEARHGPPGRKQSPAEWQKHLKVLSVDRESPEGFRPIEPPNTQCAGLANIPLAKLRWRDLIGRFDHFEVHDGGIPFPIHNKTLELGGNCVLKGSIDDRGEDLEPGEGWLDLTVAVSHTGKVPFSKLPRHHQSLCAIIMVVPGGKGDLAGLKVGDIVVGLGKLDLTQQLVEEDVCQALVDEAKSFAAGEAFSMTVVKDGQLVQVPRVGGVMLGIQFVRVPALDSDLTP